MNISYIIIEVCQCILCIWLFILSSALQLKHPGTSSRLPVLLGYNVLMITYIVIYTTYMLLSTTQICFLYAQHVQDMVIYVTYTVNHKKGGSTFVIITLENLDGF